MISIRNNKYGPIGVDIGSSAIKLIQLSKDRTSILHAARWDLSSNDGEDANEPDVIQDALSKALDSRRFFGRDAVVCLGPGELFVQNIRIASSPDTDLDSAVRQEAKGKLPYPLEEAELRYIDAAEVRYGDSYRREIVLMACQQERLEAYLKTITAVGLRPIAVDAEPNALLRCYARQYRRTNDQDQCAMFVNIGSSKTAVVIAQGDAPLFVKYLDLGGNLMDDVVAQSLGMELLAASMLRSHNRDRRRDQQDPEIVAGVRHALRPAWDRICSELSLCVRYYSVTFRQTPLTRIIISGGEANEELVQWLDGRVGVPCQWGDPFHGLKDNNETRRRSQWSVATGLALRERS